MYRVTQCMGMMDFPNHTNGFSSHRLDRGTACFLLTKTVFPGVLDQRGPGRDNRSLQTQTLRHGQAESMERSPDSLRHEPAGDTQIVDNLDVILSTMRHQLGNSVNAIKVTLDVLKQNFDLFNDTKKKDYLDRGSQLLARQQVLIDALKSYSRFDVQELTDIEVVRIWDRVSGLVRERLDPAGIRIQQRADLEPGIIRCNMTALDKIVLCLLDNAVEAMEGVEAPFIRLEAVARDRVLTLSFTDNGCGISEDDLPRIRVPLFSTKPGRAGMGLSIAHKLLLKMNGYMTIDSTPNEGTCARIRLRAA